MVRESRASDKNMFYVFLVFLGCISHGVPRSQRVVYGIKNKNNIADRL
jgi:hypothetical protein